MDYAEAVTLLFQVEDSTNPKKYANELVVANKKMNDYILAR